MLWKNSWWCGSPAGCMPRADIAPRGSPPAARASAAAWHQHSRQYRLLTDRTRPQPAHWCSPGWRWRNTAHAGQRRRASTPKARQSAQLDGGLGDPRAGIS
jgi:hypothetical protein